MATEQTSPAGRYVTLRDYLRVLRRYRLMIGVLAIIGAAAGLLDAVRQNATYQATSQVVFQDPTQDLSLVGFGSTNVQTPAQLAAVNAETATRPAVLGQVKQRLKTPLSVQGLAGSVSTQVSLPSGLLQITAKASNPRFAAQLANAVAAVLVAQDNQQTQAQFTAVVKGIKRRIATLNHGSKPKTPSSAGQLSFYEDELARLETLGAFAKSAQVAKVAGVPGSPVSPNRARSTIIGLLLGLLLGVGAAFLRDSLDRRLRTSKDIESSFHLPVLGHVRNQTMGSVAHMPNGSRGDHMLDLESFRILRRNLEFLDEERPPRSILVTSALPEEGKTTVAASLAFAMASAGRQTLLVDCDLRRPALAERLGITRSPGMSEYLAGAASPQEILRTVEFNEPPVLATTGGGSSNGHAPGATAHNLVCIPSGAPTPRGAELLGSARFQQFLEQVVDTYECVVLDSSPLLPVADTLEMLSHVDAIIVCAREFQTTRDQALAAKAALARFPERPTGLVVTGIKPQGDAYEAYSYSYGYS